MSAPGAEGGTGPAAYDVDTLAEGVRSGDRRALARAITLVESSRAADRADATDLLATLLPDAGGSIRLGISGAPGVGKSTFIQAFGLDVVARGHRVAVLAVDPTSAVSGGSILGDKTRMPDLARSPDTFIRPSPSGGTVGGVARRTGEAVLLCEAAGFDVVVVETVGTGQSDVAISGLVDLLALLVAPGGGDDLQGIKRGVMELADLVVVTKADGELAAAAGRAAADYRAALGLLRPRFEGWPPRVVTCSSLTGEGIGEVWEGIEEASAALRETGELAAQRERQAVAAMWSEVRALLTERIEGDTAARAEVDALERQVREGTLSPAAAAARLLASLS